MHNDIVEFDGETFFRMGKRCEPEDFIPKGPHVGKIERAKPRTHHYSYSNERSQGALICQTSGFPSWFDKTTHDFHCAYSDRIGQWDRNRLEAACKIAKGGPDAWPYRCPSLTQEELCEFAKVALNLPVTPDCVRVVYYFNVATGYGCPTVEAVCKKQQ